LRIERLVPTPGRGDVLIKVIACGVATATYTPSTATAAADSCRWIPGHEVAGHVAALGEGVTDMKVGDAVGVP
jgi:propanol-preferring alcohol dehydrogenase